MCTLYSVHSVHVLLLLISSMSSSKRSPFSVDFMGMRVSYPQYLRLMALQEKVIKLDKLIQALHSRFSLEQLDELPQYQRLISLHKSLAPLLPSQQANAAEEETPAAILASG